MKNPITSISTKSLKALLKRTAGILREETTMLKKNPGSDVSEISIRKNRQLFELSIAMKDMDGNWRYKDVHQELDDLKKAAAENEHTLSANIEAAKQVIQLLGNFVQENNNDGTYNENWTIRSQAT